MKTGLVLILLLTPTLLLGQEWAPIGAKWYYDHYDGFPPYLTTIQSIKDTIVNQKNCRILQTLRISKKMRPNGSYYWDTIKVSEDYLYYSNDTIFHFYDSDFYPLYVFNVNQFDTILVREGSYCQQADYYCYRFEYIVDSISAMDINSQDYKLIYNSPTDSSDWVFNIPWNYETNPIIERIGSSKYFFGVYKDAVLEGDIRCLRCYTDNLISYKADYWTNECDYLPPLNGGTDIINCSATTTKVIPNPFNSYIKINTEKQVHYKLYDLSGRLILEGTNIKINTESLHSGLYLLRLYFDNNNTETIKMIKHLP